MKIGIFFLCLLLMGSASFAAHDFLTTDSVPKTQTESPEGVWYGDHFFYREPASKKFPRGNWTNILAKFGIARRAKERGSFFQEGKTFNYEANDTLLTLKPSSEYMFASHKVAPVDFSKPNDITVPNPDNVKLSDQQRWLIHYVNCERMRRGIAPATIVDRLMKSAQMRTDSRTTVHASGDFAKKHRIGAENWADANGEGTAKDVMYWGGYDGPEQLSKTKDGIAKDEGAYNDNRHSSWMNSLGHRGTVLNPIFDEIGVGKTGSLWILHMGKARETN